MIEGFVTDNNGNRALGFFAAPLFRAFLGVIFFYLNSLQTGKRVFFYFLLLPEAMTRSMTGDENAHQSCTLVVQFVRGSGGGVRRVIEECNVETQREGRYLMTNYFGRTG